MTHTLGQPDAILKSIADSLMATIPLLAVRVAWADEAATCELSFNGGAWQGYTRLPGTWESRDWVFFAEELLSKVQDVVTVGVRSPWPGMNRKGGWEFACPFAQLAPGGTIRWGYGAEPGPLMVLAPISL
jgi:hypothetical protein